MSIGRKCVALVPGDKPTESKVCSNRATEACAVHLAGVEAVVPLCPEHDRAHLEASGDTMSKWLLEQRYAEPVV